MAKSGKRSVRRSPSSGGRRGPRGLSLAAGIRGGLAISPLVAMLATPALADPEGAQVAAGSATFSTNGSVTTIHAADRTIINYSGFDIAGHETVRFVQPGPNARVLNRINSAMPTRIDGTLLANGQVYIANPAGVIFGKGSIINAAGIYAAAGSISDADFLKGVNRFTDLDGDVINHGSIYADSVHLLGRHVANFGSIEARDVVTLMAGDEVLIGERGGHIYARMNASELAEQAQALGESGTMLARGDVYSVAIHDLSSLRAQSVQVQADVVTARGTIDASNVNPGRTGGRVELLGDRVAVDGARIDVSGHSGGGDVRIGGGFRGQEAGLRNAQATLVTPGSTIDADALVSGDGGSVVIWSDQGTAFGGSISAAGADTGHGGLVEVSGKKGLAYRGDVQTPGGDNGGREGTLLLDPEDIRVVADGTGDSIGLTDVDSFLDPDTNLDADSFPNEIEVSVITSATSDVILQAERDITFDAELVMTNDAISLMAEAGRDITVNQPITTRGGSVTLIANSSSASFQQDGSITINAAIDTAGGGVLGGAIDLVIDGGSGRVNLLADLSTDGGAVTIDGPLRLTGLRTIDTAGMSDTAGSITFTGVASPSDASTSLDLDARATITGGDVTIQAIDGSDADVLNSLDVRTAADGGGSGVIALEGDVLTSGDQTYDGFVAMGGGASSLHAESGQIVFDDALSLGSGTKTLRGSDIDFNGPVTSSVTTPATLVLATGSDARVGGAVEAPGVLTLTLSEQANLAGPFAAIAVEAGDQLFVSNGNNSFDSALTLRAITEVVLENGSILSTTGHTITFDGLGDVRLDSGATSLITTGLAGGDIVLSPGGVVRTTGGVSDGSLTLSAGSGDVVFGTDVGIIDNAPGLLSVSTSGALRLNAQTTRAVSIDFGSLSGPIVVDGDVSIITDGALDLSSARSIIAAGGTPAMLSLQTPLALSLPAVGADSLLGAMPLDTLVLDSTGLTLGGDVTVGVLDSSGVSGAVLLASDVALTATASGIDLSNASGIDGVVGGEAFTLTADDASLPTIGGSVAIGDVTLSTTGGVTLLGDVTLDNGAFGVTGPLTIAADLAINTGGGNVDLSASEVNGSGAGMDLLVNAAAGEVDLANVGQSQALGSIDVNASAIHLGGDVTTDSAGGGSGVQRYTGTTTITGLARELLTDGVLTFASGFGAGATNVTLSGSEIDFGGVIGGSGSLTLMGLEAAESFRIGFGVQQAGSVDLTAAELALIQSGFSTITIGRSSASAAQSILIGGGGSVSFNNPVVLRAPAASSSVVVDTDTTVDHSGLLGAFIRIIGSGATTTLRPNAQLLAADAAIDINTPVLLAGAGARTLTTTGAAGVITIDGPVTADAAGAVLNLNAVDAGVALRGSIGTLAMPLDELNLATGDVEIGSGSAGVDWFASRLGVSMVTGAVRLLDSARVVISGADAVDLSSSAGITAADATQSLTLELGAGGATLPGVGTAVDRLAGLVVTGGPVTLGDSVFVTGGDIDLSGASSAIVLPGASPIVFDAADGNVLLPMLTGQRGIEMLATGDGLTTGVIDFGGVPAMTADIPTSLLFQAERVDLRGDVRARGLINFGSTPLIDVYTSITIDSDPLDSIGGVVAGSDAGDIRFDSLSTVSAAGLGMSIAVDASADGGGAGGRLALPGSFFQGFTSTQLSAGLIELNNSIVIEGDVELIGRVEQSATVTIDTNADNAGASGFIDLDQAIFHTTAPGLTLTLDTSSGDAAAGDIMLMAADDFFGSASYLAGVTLRTAGVGPVSRVLLSTAIDLDATMASHGLTLLGGAELRVTKDAAIRTSIAGNAGVIDIAGSTLFADGMGADTNLVLDASSASGAGGNVRLGAVDTTGEAFTSLTIDSTGATGNGLITTGSAATTVNSFGDVTIAGTLELVGDLVIETLGGRIDLSATDISAASAARTLSLRVIDSMGGDGLVGLGRFGNRGGAGTFVNGVAIDTTAASDGTLTLNDVVLLNGPAGFVFDGPAVAINGSITIDTHQAGGSASGPIFLRGAVFGTTPGASLTLDASTPAGVASTGGIEVASLGDLGGAGAFLSMVRIDTRGDSSGTFANGGDLLLDGELAVFGIWSLGSSTLVNTNADGLGDAGTARFSETFITDGGSAFGLTIDTSAATNAVAGDVIFGDLDGSGGVSVHSLTVIADAGNGAPGTGSDGVIRFEADNAASSTLSLSTLNFDRVRGGIVLAVPTTSITTANANIDLSSAASIDAGALGGGSLLLDAGTASVVLPTLIGQNTALGGLTARGDAGIQVNGSMATSTAGGQSAAILLDGPVFFNTTSILATSGGTIEITGQSSLLNGAAVTMRTTQAGAAGADIILRDVLGETASMESLSLDAGVGGLQLYGSVGTDLVPLASLELVSSGLVEFGPTSGIGASFVADEISATNLSGHARLMGDTRFAVGGTMAMDLGNLASSGVEFGINAATAGIQRLTIDAPLADVVLSALGQQTALRALEITSANLVTLRGSAQLQDADFTGTMRVALDSATGGPIEVVVTDGDILFHEDSGINGRERLVLTTIDSTNVTPRMVKVGRVGTNGRLLSFEVNSDNAEFWGNIFTNGGGVGIFADALAMRSITIDTHANGGANNAGDVTFATGGERFDGFTAGTHTLTIDATADGGGASGEIVLPSPFFQEFAHVELRAGHITLANDISIEGSLTIASDVELTGLTTIDTNTDDLGDSGALDLSGARFFGSGDNLSLTIDASTTQAGFSGGRIDLGRFDNGGSQSYLGEVLVIADSFAVGTTPADVALHEDVLLDGADPFFGIDSSGVVTVDRGSLVTISLNAGGTANGTGGSIDLARPTIRSGAAGSGLSLLTAAMGQIDLGRVERGVMGLESLTLDSFGGLNQLGDTVETSGTMTFRGALTVIQQTLTLDTDGALGDFAGTTFAADANALDLTIRTAGPGGTGVLLLGGVDESAGAFAGTFLNDLTLEAGDRISLSGDVFLEGFGADTGDLLVASGNAFRIVGARTIDTQQGGGTDAGSVRFTNAGTTIDADGSNSELTVDTSAVGSRGGDVRLARTLGLASLTLDTTGTTDGITDLPALIDISGPVTVRGSLRVSGSSTIATDFDGVGGAGDIDLTEAAVFADSTGRTLVLDTSAASGPGGDVILGLVTNTASGTSGSRLGTLAVSTGGSVAGDLILDRTADDVVIDVVTLDLDGGMGYGGMSGFVEVARTAEVATRTVLDLSPSAGVRNIGTADTLIDLINFGGGAGAQGIVLPSGGVGTQSSPFGEVAASTFGSNTILALGDVFTRAAGGATGDATFVGNFTLAPSAARMVFADGGTAGFFSATPGGPAVNLTNGALTIMADAVNVVGSISGAVGSSVFLKPASGDTIGLGDGVNPTLDLLVSRSTLAAFGESIGRVTIGNPAAGTGTSLIEVGTFDIKTNLTLRTPASGRIDLLGSVTTTGDELRLQGPAAVKGVFTLNTTGPSGNFSGGAFASEMTLDGTTAGALLNGRRLGTDRLRLTLGTAGDALFHDAVGATTPIGDITVTNGRDVVFDSSVHASSLRQGATAGTADDGTGGTVFFGPALFAGTQGVVLETDSVAIYDDVSITGGAGRFTADVRLEGDVLSASQMLVFDRTLRIVGDRTIDSTLSMSMAGPASGGAAMDFAFIDGEFDSGGKGDSFATPATLLLIAGNGDVTIGLPGSGGSIVGGVGLNIPNGLLELRIASAGLTVLDGPVRVGGLVQEDGDSTQVNALVTTFDGGIVDLLTRTRIDVDGGIESDGLVTLQAPAIALSSDVSAISDPISFIGATTVAGDVTVFSGPGFGGDITFDGTLNAAGPGANTLTLNSGVAKSIFFEGAVGGSAPLSRITIEQAQDVTARDMFIVGQLFQTDTQDLTHFEGGLDVAGTSDLNGNRYRFETSARFGGPATITNFGLIEFPAIPVTLLNSFTQDGIGATNVATSLIATNDLTFAADVNVLAPIGFGGRVVTIGSDLNIGANAFSVTADEIEFNGGADSVFGSSSLLLQPRSSTAAMDLGSPSGSETLFSLSTEDLAALRNGFATITIGRDGGAHVVNVGIARFRDPTTIRYSGASGRATVFGSLDGDDNATLTLRGSGGGTKLIGDVSSAGNNVLIDDAVVIAGEPSAITTGGGDLRITGAIDGMMEGSGSLTVDTAAGTATFEDELGMSLPIGTLSVAASEFFSQSITTVGNQAINAAFTPGGDVTSRTAGILVVGPTSLITDTRFAAGGAGTAITFDGTINGAFNAEFANPLGTISFNAPIGGTSPLASINAAAGTINALAVTTTGSQSYNGAAMLGGELRSNSAGSIELSGPVTLLADITVATAGNSSEDSISIGQTDGTFALSLDAGEASITATGPMGTVTPLASLDASASLLNFLSVISQGAQTYTGDALINGTYSASAASGGITFNDAVTLVGNSSMFTNANLLVQGAVNGAFALNVNTTADGTATFSSPIGAATPLTSLEIISGLATLQNVTTSGFQRYLADVDLTGNMLAGGSLLIQRSLTLNSDTLLDANGVSVGGPLNGGVDLSVSAGPGDASFTAIGNTSPLTSFTVLDAANVASGPITAGTIEFNAVNITTNALVTTLTDGLFVNNTGTWQVLPGAGFTLAGPLQQQGTGPTAISTNVTTATDMFFSAPVELRADSVTLTGPNVSLLAGVRNDGSPRAIVINAEQVARLTGDFGSDASPLGGFSTGNSGRVDLAQAEIVSATGVRFDQPVIIDGDNVVRVTGARNGGGSQTAPAAVAQLGNRAPLPGLSPDSIVFTDVILGTAEGSSSLTLLTNLDATGSLIPKIFLGNDVGVAINSTSGLDLSGFGPLGTLNLNADPRFSPNPAIAGGRNGHTTLPTVATIMVPTSIAIATTDTYRVGLNEKFTTLDSIAINALGQVFTGDINAGGSILINAPLISILSRASGPVLEIGGVVSQDLGTDFIAADSITFNGNVAVLSFGGGQITLATLTGGGTSGSLSNFSTRSIDDVNVAVLSLGFDLRSEGSTNTNVSQAIAGAVPRASEGDDVSQAASVSAAQKDVLRKLGVFARDASDAVLRAGLLGRSVYADYNDPDPLTRRQEVTAQRLDEQTVAAVVEIAQRLLFGDQAEGDNVDAIDQPTQVMREALNRAVDDWAQAEDPQEWDAAALLAFMQANADEHADAITALQVLDEVLRQVELIGLSPGEVRDQRSVLLGQVRPVRLKLRQFFELVQLSQNTQGATDSLSQG